jgi:hypothetical protein
MSNTKILNDKKTRYLCPECHSDIKNNPTTIKTHQKSKKHIKSLEDNNVPILGRNKKYIAGAISKAGSKEAYLKIAAQKKKEYRARLKAKLPSKPVIPARPSADKIKQLLNPNILKIKPPVPSKPTYIKKREIKKAVKVNKTERKNHILDILESRSISLVDGKHTVSKGKKISKDPSKRKTISANLSRMAIFYKKLKGVDYDVLTSGFSWLKDYKNIEKKIKEFYPTISYQKNLFFSIAAVLNYLDNCSELQHQYSLMGFSVSENIDKKLKDNKLSKNQEKYIKWKEIKNIRKKLTHSKGSKKDDVAIASILTLLPPRRLQDYSLMKVVRQKTHHLPLHLNYLFVDKNNYPTSLVINKYKSAPLIKWGRYRLKPLPVKLAKKLQTYINNNDIRHYDSLFKYTPSNFGVKINKIFGVGVNNLRSAFVSYKMKKLKSQNDKEDLARAMGTSVHQLEHSYYKQELA